MPTTVAAARFGVAVAADDQVGRLAGVVQLLGQRLIAVDREAVAVAAVGVAEVAEHDDDVGAAAFIAS